jgi:3-isopropylmalate/(R)-2-methylmalate dehydratase small subunit
MILEGKVYTFGNDINTDEIIPARYLNTSDPRELARYCMEDSRPGFAAGLEAGSIIVAGRNFGCGSSREHAPLAMKAAGIACVVAASFARIFFRNAINIGLPIVESPEAADKIREGDIIRIDLKQGVLRCTSGQTLAVTPFPPFMEAIISKGGWMAYLKEQSQ